VGQNYFEATFSVGPFFRRIWHFLSLDINIFLKFPQNWTLANFRKKS